MAPHPSPTTEPAPAPIRAIKRRRSGKRTRPKHPFFDDRGFPSPQDDFESILPEPTGKVQRKRQHPARPISDIDPSFDVKFDPKIHSERIQNELKLDHIENPEHKVIIRDLVEEFWCLFDHTGLLKPVKDYVCHIDTGRHPPVAAKNPTYGPLETPKIEAAIASLVELGMVTQIFDGAWLSKALLAPKPHQEHVTDIADFIWRFCVNYIALNAITKTVAYPIPRCDDAVEISFGGSKWRWLMDCPQGFNQMPVHPLSQHKLAFAGPNGTKYTYLVMPFGIKNGPVSFIIMIHDLNHTWQSIAQSRGIVFNASTGTRIIVDDIFSWADSFETFIAYLRCQFEVCRAQNLSLSLKKSIFLPKRVTFVGHDVCDDGNRPAQSKHQLLETWPEFTDVRSISSFVGLVNFYAKYIPNMELRIFQMRELLKLEYDTLLTPAQIVSVSDERKDMIQAIIKDPCLMRWSPTKRSYLRTDACARGFGAVLLQPDDDDASLAAMNREIEGGPCEFQTKDGENLRLRPVNFCARRTRGMEPRLHSHLSEGYCSDWGINKNRTRLFGQRFTLITDCYAMRFILTYDGNNPVILRMQMRFMIWSLDIVHRANPHLIDADYFSRLGADLCFDPLYTDYLNFTTELRKCFPPVEGEIKPENMPGYRGPRTFGPRLLGPNSQPLPADTSSTAYAAANLPLPDHDSAPIVASIFGNQSGGHHHCLEVVPILFEHSSTVRTSVTGLPYNHDFPVFAGAVTSFSFAIYGFNSGHFPSTLGEHSLPFDVVLAADLTQVGRSLFKEFTSCPSISDSSDSLLNSIITSQVTTVVHGYIIHSHRFLLPNTEKKFWKTQSAIVNALRKRRSLIIFAAFIHSDCDMTLVDEFHAKLSRCGWIISSQHLSYPDFGDAIDDSTTLMIGVHQASTSNHSPLDVPEPPLPTCHRLSDFLYEPFNKPEMIVSHAKDTAAFADSTLTASPPILEPPTSRRYFSKRLYDLHRSADDITLRVGSGVYSTSGLCPPLSAPSDNIFDNTFGIEFSIKNASLVRPISQYEVASCFSLDNNLTYKMAHSDTFPLLDLGIPGCTSSWILNAIFERLVSVRNENAEIIDPSTNAAPAAVSIPIFLNGAVGTRVPDNAAWQRAYQSDKNCKEILNMLKNPALVKKENLLKLHYTYRQPMRDSNIVLEDGILYFIERFANDTKFVKLRIVPDELRNIIFIAFHANPIGAHMDAARTYSRLRLRYYFPGMFSYCKRMISCCPACALSSNKRPSADLVYSFPIAAPMHTLFADIYSVGTELNFDGTKNHLIACCGMTSFAVSEATADANAAAFAESLMKIQLRFGFCHTIVVDKDSKFRGVFAETADLLGINIHVISGENHDAMLVERVNRFLNKALAIYCTERGSVKSASNAVQLSLYAWNSAPVVGTDISRSLLVTGREFSFPIEFNVEKARTLTSTSKAVVTFAQEQARLLGLSRQVARALVDEHRAMHRELIIAKRPDPLHYEVGDMVFSRVSVKSDKKKGRVAKVTQPYTGPWEIIRKLKGSSYELKHSITGQLGKRHAAHLSPFPPNLIPYEPINTTDHKYGTLYEEMVADPYKRASIKGFEPFEPFQDLAEPFNLLVDSHCDSDPIHFPTLAELNAEFYPGLLNDENDILADDELSASFEAYLIQTRSMTRKSATSSTSPADSTASPTTKPADSPVVQPPNLPATPVSPTPPSISTLTSQLIASENKLFFIRHRIPGSSSSEWYLVRVALRDTLSAHPNALQDGKFLVDFYMLHPSDKRFNATNQRYWLEYHSTDASFGPLHQSTAHLIRPSSEEALYASANGLQPFRQWVRLLNSDTYIHGPFNFSTLNGRVTKDRVSESDWLTLRKYEHLYSNQVPPMNLQQYTVHLGQFHTTSDDQALAARFTACFATPTPLSTT